MKIPGAIIGFIIALIPALVLFVTNAGDSGLMTVSLAGAVVGVLNLVLKVMQELPKESAAESGAVSRSLAAAEPVQPLWKRVVLG